MASFKNDFLCTLPCKRIQDSLGFSIPHRVFRIPSTWFQSLSVEFDSGFKSLVGFRIPKFTIPDSTIKISWIPDSKFPQAKIFGNTDYHIWGANGLKGRCAPTTVTPVKTSLKLTSRPRPNSERYSKIYASCRSRPRENLRIGHFTSELFWGQRELAAWYT